MAIDRRSFLKTLGTAIAGSLLPSIGYASASSLYLSACSQADGSHSVSVFTEDGAVQFTTKLPDRGHDAVRRPQSNEVVIFARRPGNWAAIVDIQSGQVGKIILAPEGRHFYGHGAFLEDGHILHATENNIATGEGVIGLYDATNAYARIGELPSFGIGPHDLSMLPGGGFVIANGGIRTHPETGREMLNKDEMEPSLAVLDPLTGDCRMKISLDADLQALSIRHLAVASDGSTYFGCQFEGDPLDMPFLVGMMDREGKTRFLEMPDEDLASLNNYVGSVELDRSGEIIAATSPRGGMAAFWDRSSGKYLGRRAMPDVCGVAPAGSQTHAFILTSGNAGMGFTQAPFHELRKLSPSNLPDPMWDNHVLVL